MFEKIVHVGLQSCGGVIFWDMHSQGFEEIRFQMMQIF